MTPQKFVKNHKEEISNHFKDNFVTDTNTLFKKMKRLLSILKEVRDSQTKTEGFLRSFLDELDPNNRIDYVGKGLIVHWLVKATNEDDSYVYAYNWFASEANGRVRMEVHPLKQVDFSKLPKNSKEEFDQPTKNGSHNSPQPDLSVPDWCIIFYYLDEAGKKEGYKIERMRKFIDENNVLSRSGKRTRKGFFKKEYHEIENRINGKKDKNPLPPERVENILPYLKNNKKALEAAKNDIEHLIDIKEENEKNYY